MTETAISIEGLTKDFRSGLRGMKVRAVQNLELNVGDNQVFGLLGPNGCGKSTTMKIMLGLLQPTQGKCSIYGISSKKVASRIDVGFLPEAPYFYKFLTGRELVEYAARLCGLRRDRLRDRSAEVLELVGLNEAADRRVGTYSKGMLQRIGMAQAIVHDPRLIILDEPTAGVDPQGADDIAQLIRELKNRGKTILLCSHLLAQVEGLCDHVAIMSRGKLVLEGSVDNLLKRDDLRQITIRGFEASDRADFEKWLSERGKELVSVEAPKISLDRLFLEKTGGH